MYEAQKQNNVLLKSSIPNYTAMGGYAVSI